MDEEKIGRSFWGFKKTQNTCVETGRVRQRVIYGMIAYQKKILLEIHGNEFKMKISLSGGIFFSSQSQMLRKEQVKKWTDSG